MSQIVVQASEWSDSSIGAPYAAGNWRRHIPSPGCSSLSIPAIRGVADASNVIADSPPTLFEAFSFYSYAVGWYVELGNNGVNFTTPPNVQVELALLVNDRRAYTTSMPSATELNPGANQFSIGSGAFVSDLVNPILVGPRERLSLMLGIQSDQPVWNFTAGIGTQATNPATGVYQPLAFESTLSFNTIIVPGRRRL